MPENDNNVVPLHVRVQGVEQARAFDVMGMIVTWDRNNSEARRESIAAAFASVDLADLAPEERETKQALRAALASRFSKKNRRVAPAQDGYEVLIENPIPGQRRVQQQHVVSVWIETNANGDEMVVTDEPSFTVDGDTYTTQDIVEWVEEARRKVDYESISAALVKAGARLRGVALRGGGGSYWIPRGSSGRWLQLKEGLEAAGRPMMMGVWETKASAVSIESTINSVASHVDKRCDMMLEAIGSGTLGVRALDTKTDEAVELVAQIAEYEAVLGQGLEALKQKVLSVQQASVQAAMLAHAEREERTRARRLGASYDENAEEFTGQI
jgi:hypothetical protein